jgi:mannosyltransferase
MAGNVFGRVGVWAWAPVPKPRELARYGRNLDALSLGVWVVAAVGAALRWYEITAEGFWLDEVASLEFAVRRYDSVLELVTTVPVTDPHPPLYYLLLRWWTGVFGTTEFGLRSMSLFFGVLTVLLTYLLTVKLFDNRGTGLVAASLVSVSMMHVYFGQEARMYTLLTTTTLASFYWYVDVVLAENPSRSSVARYVVATALLGYTHTFGAFLILAQQVHALLLARREVLTGVTPWQGNSERGAAVEAEGDGERGAAVEAEGDGDVSEGGTETASVGRLGWIPRLPGSALFRRWAASQVGLGVLLAPWVVILAGHVFGLGFVDTGDTDWIPGRQIWYMFDTFEQYFFYNVYEFSLPGHGLLIWLAIGLAIAAFLRFTPEADPEDEVDEVEVGYSDRTLMLGVWLVVPILTPFVLSWLVKPIYIHKYTIGASLAFFILVARGIQKLEANYSSLFAYGLVAILLVGVAAPMGTIYEDPQKPDWREVTHGVEDESGPDPLVLTTPTFMNGTIEYYASEETTVESIRWNATWNETLSDLVADRDRVWFVYSTWHMSESQVQHVSRELAKGGYEFDFRDQFEREAEGDSHRLVLGYAVIGAEFLDFDSIGSGDVDEANASAVAPPNGV